MRPSFSLVIVGILAFGLTRVAAADGEIDFQNDIQPIFAEHCARCHGVDEETREAGLRLDVRQAAIDAGAIVPGDSTAGSLIERITAADESIVMPPPDEQRPLSSEQIQMLKDWLDQGATYSAHWAFTKPVAVDPATLRATDASESGSETGAQETGVLASDHPIDAIVAAKLDQWGLSPAPPAASATLCRRLYLDLIGLPPSPAQLAEFEQQGVEATIDKLLSSQRYGEKWARHWMDVARYSDTNGYEKDLRREQWIWRDWVIDALNQDKPYNEFLIEQIAGDLLENPTPQQIVATGFLRNSMLNEEGAIVPEQFRMVEMFDRMDCIGKAVLGLTTQCAQCHSHKFDPLTHTEYYGLFAYLNNAYEAKSWVYDPQQQQQLAEIEKKFTALNDQVRAANPDWPTAIETWQLAILDSQPQWAPVSMSEFGSVSGLSHPVHVEQQQILMLGHVSEEVFFVSEPVDLSGVTGIRLELLTHRDLAFNGPGRDDVGSWGVQEFEVFAWQPSDAHDQWQKLELTHATADWSEPERKQEGEKVVTGPVGLMIDGNRQTAWRADRGLGRRNQPSVAVVQFKTPLALPPGSKLKFALHTGRDGMVGCCRVSLTHDQNPTALAVDHAAVLAMQTPLDRRSEQQTATIFDAWRRTLPASQSLAAEFDALWQTFPTAATSVLHLAEREPDRARLTRLLDRGEWDRPLESVTAHTPAALHPMPQEDGPPRLNFARWLASDQSPLTARVAVNRVWQSMFGSGLVETSEDFGTRAPVPEHLELLDWLAVDFMQHGWSQKHLVRRIVTSRTYQQDSAVTEQLRQRDPHNRLLARGPRFRADGEVIRDIALTAAGLLCDNMGGPSVIPPVPENVLKYNYTYPDYWKAAEAPERYRRSVYGFRKRSMPDPVMSSLDAPNGDTACARRVRSNTPLAALTGLNETIFVEAARGLAWRVLGAGELSDAARVDLAFLLCTGRKPKPAEQAEILSLLDLQLARIEAGQLDAQAIAGDPPTTNRSPASSASTSSASTSAASTSAASATPPAAAAWTLIARVLLNLDETISKN